MQHGIEYLLETQRADGSWDEELATGTGFPKVFYLNYHLYKDYFPLLALTSFVKARTEPQQSEPRLVIALTRRSRRTGETACATRTRGSICRGGEQSGFACLACPTMKPALVTGASGFLGWHVARVLLERGYRVRALVRPGSRVDALDVECVTGDLRDPASLERAVAGCGLVFHVAADYRLWARDPGELYRSNVDGTRNLLQAARQAGVERVVYTSTVGCIGIPAGGIGDEHRP